MSEAHPVSSPGPLPPPVPARVHRVVYLLFFLSGASGLVFETLWSYQATLALGSSYWAVTAVLSALMAGLALGSLLTLRRTVWTLKTYAALEGIILITGLAALFVLPRLGGLLAPVFLAAEGHPAIINGLRFASSFVVLVLPSTAMGATLPALAQALGGEHGSFRTVLGRLYGLNTLGAIGGVLGSELVLLPQIGVFGTGAFAALLNGAAAMGAWRLSGRVIEGGPSANPVGVEDGPRSLGPPLLVIFLAGFALLALEVLWSRFLALFVPNTSLAFALMLATVLSGIALGGIAGSLPWIRRPFGFLLLFGAGVAVLACYAGFPWYHHKPEVLLEEPGWIVLIGFILQFPVSFLSGAFFTLAGAELRDRVPSSQASAGLLMLSNTFGAAAGAVVAGFALIPLLGVEKSFFVLSLVYAAAAGTWYLISGGNRTWLIVGGGVWLAALAMFPFGQFQRIYIPAIVKRWCPDEDVKIPAFREGLNETILLVQPQEFGQPFYTRLITNSISMSANSVVSRRYMNEFVYWPLALHRSPRRALLICFGVGNTARALTRTRELEHIDVVDLSGDILELNSLILPDPASQPLKDPRVSAHVEDGRFFLQSHSETWDLITGEPPPPNLPGVAGLYSVEYFRLIKARLSEGGIATYWLPIHTLSEPASLSILKAWSETFEACFLWRGSRSDLMLIGFRGRPSPVGASRFLEQWKDPAVLNDLAEVGLELPETLGTGFIGDADYIRSITATAEPTTDAFPKRILAPNPKETAVFQDWYNLPGCAARFRASRSIAELWPAEMKSRTLPYFEWEAMLSTVGTLRVREEFPDFAKIHHLCTTTPFRAPISWLMRSNADHQQAAGQADPEIKKRARPQFHLGVRALADRNYSGASEHFLRAVEDPEMSRIDFASCLFALCMAGRKEEADRILAKLWDETKMKAIPAPYWSWMKATFDLRVPGPR